MTPAITGLASTDTKQSPKRAHYNESSLYILQIDKKDVNTSKLSTHIFL